MLGGGLAQHGDAFAVEEDDRAEVDVELHVQALGLDLGERRSDADAGVVHEHIQAVDSGSRCASTTFLISASSATFAASA